MTVIDYVTEEVTRQGHNVLVLEGIERVAWMLSAWAFAIEASYARKRPTIEDVLVIGTNVEQQKNRNGFRSGGVMIGGRTAPGPEDVDKLLSNLWREGTALTPIQFYKEFEFVHPFFDGNGRTGKILLNWLNGTLLNPIFPPADLWGRAIRNP